MISLYSVVMDDDDTLHALDSCYQTLSKIAVYGNGVLKTDSLHYALDN